MNNFFVILILSLLFAFNVTANDDLNNTFWVKTSSLKCVLSRVDEYLALEKDPIIVFFDICPNIQPSTKEILKVSKNSLPKIKNSSVPDSESVVQIIALSREELMCLSQMDPDGTILESLKMPGTEIFATKISLENCKSSKMEVPTTTDSQ